MDDETLDKTIKGAATTLAGTLPDNTVFVLIVHDRDSGLTSMVADVCDDCVQALLASATGRTVAPIGGHKH